MASWIVKEAWVGAENCAIPERNSGHHRTQTNDLAWLLNLKDESLATTNQAITEIAEA
ncbi:MAG: hypothetical protein WCD57_15090 [Acidobacteriaceae bacterium]